MRRTISSEFARFGNIFAFKIRKQHDNEFIALWQHKYFSKPMLDNWLNLIDKAYSNILKYQNNDPVLYEKLHSRIAIEAMSIRYMIIDLYAGRFSPEKLKTMQNQFMQDCFKYGIDMVAELDEISIIFQQWGIL